MASGTTALGEKSYHLSWQRRLKSGIGRYWISYAFMAPFLIIFAIFVVVGVGWAIYLSFTYYNMIQAPVWVGLENYTRLFTDDPVFILSLKNTLYFSLITGPIGYIISLTLAWLINEVKFKKAFIFAFYTPSIASAVAIGIVWLYIFGGDKYGLLNFYLGKIGLLKEPILWLRDPAYTLPSIMAVSLWQSMGTGFLVFVAGLQGIPRELYEAGEIDGTSKIQELFHITLPLMKPQLLFGAIIAVVNSFQVFDLSFVMAGFPSVLYSAHTIVGHLWDYAFIRFEMGYAAAVSVVLFFSTLIISRVLVRLLSSKDVY